MTRTAFDTCFGDFGFGNFSLSIWDRVPLFVTGDGRPGFADLFNSRHLCALLEYSELRAPLFRVFQDGTPLPPSTVTTSRRAGPGRIDDYADSAAISRCADQGATVALLSIHQAHAGVGSLCKRLATELGSPVAATAYFGAASNVDALGVQCHGRDHLVVLQIEGRTHWTLWDATAVRTDAEGEPVAQSVRELTQVTEATSNYTLVSGDVLYIPRAFAYSARLERPSLFLVLSIQAMRWNDLISAAAKFALRAIKSDRPGRALPFGYHRANQPHPDDDMAVAVLTDAFVAGLRPEQVDAILNKRVSYSPARVGALVSRVTAPR